jgi:hypothetical protein
MKRIAAFIVVFLTIGTLQAMTMYIDHKAPVLLFASPDTTSTVVTQISGGTPVVLLKTNLENGFSFIETIQKKKGWLQTQFLLNRPPKPHYSLWQRAWHHVMFWHEPPVVKSAVVPDVVSSHKNNRQGQWSVAVNRLQQKVVTLQQEVTALRARQHSPLFWFVWGAMIALLGMFVGSFLKGRKRSRSLFK